MAIRTTLHSLSFPLHVLRLHYWAERSGHIRGCVSRRNRTLATTCILMHTGSLNVLGLAGGLIPRAGMTGNTRILHSSFPSAEPDTRFSQRWRSRVVSHVQSDTEGSIHLLRTCVNKHRFQGHCYAARVPRSCNETTAKFPEGPVAMRLRQKHTE